MKVLKSWGASGEVVLSRSNGDPQDMKSLEPAFIEFDGLPVPFFFESVQEKGNRLIVKFEDVDSLAEAEELVGRTVIFQNSDEEEEDTLVGLRVCDSRSRRLIGEITAFNDYGGNIVLSVETTDGKEILLPLHEELIVSIHDETITLDIPTGLL